MRRAILAVFLGLAVAGSARAQTLEDRLRSQLVVVTNQLRDAQAGQAAAVADKASAEKVRDGLKAELAKAQAQLKAAKRAAQPTAPPAELQAAEAKAAQSQQADAEDRSQLSAARADARRMADQLAQMQAERDRGGADLTKAAASLQVCQTKNAELIAVAKEILTAYDRVSFGGVLARKEPFTGLKRVQIETIEQNYGDRIYDGRLDVKPKTLTINGPAPAVSAPAPGKPR